MDKATLKKFNQFKKEFFAHEVHYYVSRDKIKIVKNVVAVAIPGEALLLIRGNKITTINWFAVIEFTCPMNERTTKMALKALESIEEAEKFLNFKRDPRNPEVG